MTAFAKLIAAQIVYEVGRRYGIEPEVILSKRRHHRFIQARIEVAKLLTNRKWSTTQIGKALGRDHTTITYYLGGGKRKASPPRKPRWRQPRVKHLYYITQPRQPVQYLVPYAGADWTEYQWKERRA